jgi:hypothetical protein
MCQKINCIDDVNKKWSRKMDDIKKFLTQIDLENNPVVSSNELQKVSELLDVESIQKWMKEDKQKTIKKHIQNKSESFNKQKAPYVAVILYMAVCFATAHQKINPFDMEKYYLQLQPSQEGQITNSLCSIIWGIDRKVNKKVFVIKPGMMRCEHDQLLYQLFEYMQKKTLLPNEMHNIFIHSFPAAINISEVALPTLKKNGVKNRIDDYHLIYETATGYEIEVELKENKDTNGLLLVGVQEVLYECDAAYFKQWIKKNPLNFVLMIGVLRLINARDLKMNGIMLNADGNPVIIDCEDFLRKKKSLNKQPIADLHIPFIDSVIDEKIPLKALKEASAWFKKWVDKKQVLSSFMKKETFIFEECRDQTKAIEEKCFSNDQNVTDCIFTNSVEEDQVDDADSEVTDVCFDAFTNQWNDLADHIDPSDKPTQSYGDKFNEDEDSYDEYSNIIPDISGLRITKSQLSDSTQSESPVKKNIDTNAILSDEQSEIFYENLTSLAQNFVLLPNTHGEISVKEMMRIFDQQWHQHYKMFATPSNDSAKRLLDNLPKHAEINRSFASLVGLFSPSDMGSKNSLSSCDSLSNSSLVDFKQ